MRRLIVETRTFSEESVPFSRKTETRKLRAIIVAGFPIFGNFRVAAGFNIVDVISVALCSI